VLVLVLVLLLLRRAGVVGARQSKQGRGGILFLCSRSVAVKKNKTRL
jgi:hypothetical protein